MSEREKLIRECFELERDFNYWPFRQEHWEKVEIVATLPESSEREQVLRDFWEHDAEKRFPEYRKAVSGLTLVELEAEKEQWLDRLSCVGTQQFQEILAETVSKEPVNDNRRSRGR